MKMNFELGGRSLRVASMRALIASSILTCMSPSIAEQVAVALPDKAAFPESVTSTKDGTLYAGSLFPGGIFRISAKGAAEPWLPAGAFGSASILGVLVDERTKTLWACSNDYSSYGVHVEGALHGAALLAFDLDSREQRVRLPLPSDPSSCNDIVVGPEGAIYVTNSETPEILKLAPGAKQLELWYSEPSLRPAPGGSGLDGIAFGGDGNLYVSHYDAGTLYRIDVEKGKAARLTKLQTSRPLILPDTIRFLRDNTFLLVEGGGRLNSMKINGDTVSLQALKDGFDTPTSVTVIGATAWVSEGQLQHLLEPAKALLPFKLFPVAIAK